MRSLPTMLAGVVFSVALATIAGCKNSSTNPTGTHPDVTIEIVSRNGANSFSPNPATAVAGQKIAWHNGDVLTHTATANGGQFNTGDITPGSTSSIVVVSTAGSFGYHCTHHPDMTGTLTVTAQGTTGNPPYGMP